MLYVLIDCRFKGRTWKLRYVIISEGCVYIYHDMYSKTAEHAYSLRHFDCASESDPEKGHEICFCLRYKNAQAPIMFSCDTRENREKWLEKLWSGISEVEAALHASSLDSGFGSAEALPSKKVEKMQDVYEENKGYDAVHEWMCREAMFPVHAQGDKRYQTSIKEQSDIKSATINEKKGRIGKAPQSITRRRKSSVSSTGSSFMSVQGGSECTDEDNASSLFMSERRKKEGFYENKVDLDNNYGNDNTLPKSLYNNAEELECSKIHKPENKQCSGISVSLMEESKRGRDEDDYVRLKDSSSKSKIIQKNTLHEYAEDIHRGDKRYQTPIKEQKDVKSATFNEKKGRIGKASQSITRGQTSSVSSAQGWSETTEEDNALLYKPVGDEEESFYENKRDLDNSSDTSPKALYNNLEELERFKIYKLENKKKCSGISNIMMEHSKSVGEKRNQTPINEQSRVELDSSVNERKARIGKASQPTTGGPKSSVSFMYEQGSSESADRDNSTSLMPVRREVDFHENKTDIDNSFGSSNTMPKANAEELERSKRHKFESKNYICDGKDQIKKVSNEKSGVFAVCPGQSTSQELCVRTPRGLKTFRIHWQNEKVSLFRSHEMDTFDTVDELLSYYSDNSLPGKDYDVRLQRGCNSMP